MKKLLSLFAVVGVCVLAASCNPSDEALGNKAYERSKKATGRDLHMQQKAAYTHYRDAVMKNPGNISAQLRERYIDMAITRVFRVLEEGGANYDAVGILMKEIEDVLTPETPEALRTRYANFIVQLADSSKVKGKFIDALGLYDKAIEKAVNPEEIRSLRQAIIKSVAQENYLLSMNELTEGRDFLQQNPPDSASAIDAFIRAEYYAKAALYFDSTHSDAQKQLSEMRKLNRGRYSAFLRVIEHYTDTVAFKRINDRNILLAVPEYRIMGNRAVAIVSIYNYSNNNHRMKAEDFYLEDINGQRYRAEPSRERLVPDFLEYEREGTYTLRFPVPRAPVRRLIYENEAKYFSDKYFF